MWAERLREWNTATHAAAAFNDRPVFEALIEGGADLSARSVSGHTALRIAATRNKIPAVIDLLIRASSDIGVQDPNGRAILHEAVGFNGEPAVVELLVDAGVDVDAKANDGQTPLHSAIAGTAGGPPPNPAVIEALLQAGADANAKSENGIAPLHLAAWRADDPTVIELLIESGADPDARARLRGESVPLHIAATVDKNSAVLKALIKAGANVNVVNGLGFSLLHKAAEGNDPAFVKQLVGAGADPNERHVPKKDTYLAIPRHGKFWPSARAGWTPLHMAAAHSGSLDVVETVLEAGADVNTEAFDGSTPLHAGSQVDGLCPRDRSACSCGCGS